MMETVLLGAIAERVPEQKIIWNPAEMEIANFPQATALMRRPYREGRQLKF